jgi:hypothetical protein
MRRLNTRASYHGCTACSFMLVLLEKIRCRKFIHGKDKWKITSGRLRSLEKPEISMPMHFGITYLLRSSSFMH